MTIPRLLLPVRWFRAAVMCLFSAAVGYAATATFDIPAQAAPAALQLFMKQSGAQVMFSQDKLKSVQSAAVKGAYEHATALNLLLAGTGYEAHQPAPANFVVAAAAPKTGSVEGTLRSGARGTSITGVIVTVRESGEHTTVAAGGVFKFPALSPGSYTLIASGEGFSRLRITDVVVRSATDLVLGPQEMPAVLKDGEVQTMKEIVVSARKDIETLSAVEVSEGKVKPFSGGNMDIPRTIDDAQPYYIFDAKTIDSSGATNVEDFLKQRLSMNTLAQANGDISGQNTRGNTSSINLRGVGTDKTLVLVNGRRMAGVNYGVDNYQPDLNGIPLNAIDRIEVLPSSASGIYGGSAIGGVVNVVLKKNYQGGEIRATYDNTWDSDAPRRTLSLNYGLALEGGKTHVNFSASWSDMKALLLQDRVGPFKEAIAGIQSRSPTYFYSSTSPWLGVLPNITTTAASLILDNGTSLNSKNTYVPANTSGTTPSAQLAAGLLANAGQWNMDLPLTTQGPTGLLQPFGSAPQTKAFQAGIRRQMWPRLELFVDLAYNENRTNSINNPATTNLTVPATTASNPFAVDVRVAIPDASEVPITTVSENRSATVGAVAQLLGLDGSAGLHVVRKSLHVFFLCAGLHGPDGGFSKRCVQSLRGLAAVSCEFQKVFLYPSH